MDLESLKRSLEPFLAEARRLFDLAIDGVRAEPILTVAVGAAVLLVVALAYGVRRRRLAGALPAATSSEAAEAPAPRSRAEAAPATPPAPAAPEPIETAPRLEAEAAADDATASDLAEGSLAEPLPALEPSPLFEVEGEPEPQTGRGPAAEAPPVAPTAPPVTPTAPPVAPTAPPAAPAPPHVAPEPAPVEPPRPLRLRDRLRRTREALFGRIEGILGGKKLDGAVLEDLEQVLYTADLGVATAESLLASVRKQAGGGDAAAVRAALRAAILEKLRRVEPPKGSALSTTGKPHVVLVLGVNGSGKTTTIGKLAARYQAAGKRVILGAGDTFRAAAIEQLQVWGQRVGCEVIAGSPGGDPSAVAFDTVKAALARGADVAICDTAGRLQTKLPLIEELRKIVRVIGRDVPGAPHESLLVLDANTGQNAISQARVFIEAAQVTGLVLTKLDGTAKGGVLVGLADEFGIPVKYVGVGESADDLRDFSAEEFVDAIFGLDADAGAPLR